MTVDRAAYADVADRLEAELKALGWWDSPEPEAPVTAAFGSNDRSFGQWLRYTLVPRLRAVAAGEIEPPERSMVATQAAREFDGYEVAHELIAVLVDLDELVEGPFDPERDL
jgi:uncharacterized protein YqcC (DUF446 family)